MNGGAEILSVVVYCLISILSTIGELSFVISKVKDMCFCFIYWMNMCHDATLSAEYDADDPHPCRYRTCGESSLNSRPNISHNLMTDRMPAVKVGLTS